MIDRSSLLQRAERLWKELQDNQLGGFSGINRPFWIVQTLKEVEAAAAAKARQEAIEACAGLLRRAAEISDPGWQTQEKFKSMIDATLALSAPQNPGDAAP